MVKQLLSAAGLGLAGYVVFNAWQNNTGINTDSGEGDLVNTGLGDVVGGFMSVSNTFFESNNMNISTIGLAHIKGWEKLRLNRYLDEGGKPTIGYGHLIKPLEDYDTITETQATGLLLTDLGVAMDAVNRGVKVKINQSQFDALVSFTFNVGAGAFLKSTLLKLLNKGDIAGVKLQFGKWVYVGSAPSNGLINRRAGDLKLFEGRA